MPHAHFLSQWIHPLPPPPPPLDWDLQPRSWCKTFSFFSLSYNIYLPRSILNQEQNQEMKYFQRNYHRRKETIAFSKTKRSRPAKRNNRVQRNEANRVASHDSSLYLGMYIIVIPLWLSTELQRFPSTSRTAISRPWSSILYNLFRLVRSKKKWAI